METNLLRRVFINGDPERLPKELLKIFAYSDKTGEGFHIMFNPLDKGCIENMLLFDWYEIPVPREEIIAIIKKYFTLRDDNNRWNLTHGDPKGFDLIADELIGGVK